MVSFTAVFCPPGAYSSVIRGIRAATTRYLDMSQLWHLLLTQPLLNALIGLYRITGNLGLSIITLTIGLRLALTPLILPSLHLNKKIQELAPEMAKLKEQYKNDKQGLITAQAQLYKQHGANPASGCLPQVIQLLILIALFSVFNTILRSDGTGLADKLNPSLYSFNQLEPEFQVSRSFLYLDLTKSDTIKVPGLPFALPGLFLVLSALAQLVNSKMMMPLVSVEKKIAQKSPQSTDDAMVDAQQQMLYMFPLMTLLIGYQFPSGLVLYWLVFSLASIVQQYNTSGWGAAAVWLKKLNLLKSAD
jgi:YidC/Oxa1 family membrane protein insertase